METAGNLPRIELLESQFDELFDDEHFLTLHVGGRGSGKTKTNVLHFLRWGAVCTDQLYSLWANTWEHMENAILPPMTEVLEDIGMEYFIEKRVPDSLRSDWRRMGIRVPQLRHRNLKLCIWRNGVHIYLGTFGGNHWRRVKGLEVLLSIAEEYPEPDTPKDFLTYLIGSTRCGKGREGECKRRRHPHKIVAKGNVPLNQPDHFIYKQVEMLQAREVERLARGERPYFRLIESDTKGNTHLQAEFDENLRAALDPETYELQTSGRLRRNTSSLTYHQYSEQNVLATLKYDPLRPLHMWFDFNVTPAAVGFGHDLRYDEIPEAEIHAKHHYFGVVGELFSDNDPMFTDQVAQALLEDPTNDPAARCNEIGCGDPLDAHLETNEGYLCRRCGSMCSGAAVQYEWSRKHLHVPPNWRGLMRHRSHIYVYGDASGSASHADAISAGGSRKILRDTFDENLGERVHFRFKEANPRIVLRELAVNRLLRSTDGIRSLFFAPWCTAHLDDCRETVPDPKTGVAKKEYPTAAAKKRSEYWKRTHCLDGLGYMVDFRWPVIIPKGGQLPQGEGEQTETPLDRMWPEP